MSVNIMEAAQVSPLTRRHVNDALSELHPRSGLEVLKGDQISAQGFNQGFNPGRGVACTAQEPQATPLQMFRRGQRRARR
jgi:hypothetical protein